MKHTITSSLWPMLLLMGLLASSPAAQATTAVCKGTVAECLKRQEQNTESAANAKMLAVPVQASSTPSSLKKSVTRFSSGAASLRQQVIQQNNVSKAP